MGYSCTLKVLPSTLTDITLKYTLGETEYTKTLEDFTVSDIYLVYTFTEEECGDNIPTLLTVSSKGYKTSAGNWFTEEVTEYEAELQPRYLTEMQISGVDYQIKDKREPHPPLLSYIWSDHIINDMNWLRADTFAEQNGKLYKAAYNKIAEEYDGGTSLQYDYDVKNFYVAGAPKFSDGIVSSFNASSYVYLPEVFSPGSNTWEIVTKFHTNANFNTGQIIFHLLTGSSDYNLAFWITTAGKISMHASNNGTSWNIFSDVLSTNTLNVDYDYWAKMEFTGTAYNMYVSVNGTDWVLEATYSSAQTILSGKSLRFGSYTDGRPIGSIDLNQTYIKIKNEMWWEPYKLKAVITSNEFKIVPKSEEDMIAKLFDNDGIAWYYIIDEENKKFKLPRSTNIKIHGQLVKSWVNGSNGYRIYADGYCEQWGHWYNGSSSFQVVTLHLPFADTNYNVQVTVAYTGATYTSSASPCYYSAAYKTTTQFQCYGYSDATLANKDWVASGYLAEGQYPKNLDNQYDSYKKYLYFYVGDFAQSALEQTAGITAEQLNDKIDKSNLTEVSAVLIETYVNGGNGYRVYSDGYCEQWGRVTYSGSTGWNIFYVTFPKVFKDANYCVTHGHQHRNYQVNTYEHLTVYALSKTGFYLNPYNYANESIHFWRACGYLEEGQY